MADARFFDKAGPFSLAELARIAGADIAGAADRDAIFHDVKALSLAGPTDVSFIDNRKYVQEFVASKAGAILAAPDIADRAPASCTVLVTAQPYRGYALIAQAFYPAAGSSGVIAPSAHIAPGARLGADVAVGPGAVVGDGCIIGAGTTIGANSVIEGGVSIGEGGRIGSNCTLSHCDLGRNVILHPGVRIGQDGFGFAPGMPSHLKVPQLGRVLIGDDVEIGANCTIDRGAAPDTVIGAGTKIDNLVHIGHNVTIGRGCLIAGQAGFSGSARIGDFVMIGGQVGVVGHLSVGDGVRISGQSGVSRDVPPGMTIAGTPAMEARDHWKNLATLNRLRKSQKDG